MLSPCKSTEAVCWGCHKQIYTVVDQAVCLSFVCSYLLSLKRSISFCYWKSLLKPTVEVKEWRMKNYLSLSLLYYYFAKQRSTL